MKFVLSVLLLFSFAQSHAQQNLFDAPPKNSFSIELGGNGLFYSVNFHRVLWRSGNFALKGRVGTMPIEFLTVTVPVVLSAEIGARRLKLTAGGGVNAWLYIHESGDYEGKSRSLIEPTPTGRLGLYWLAAPRQSLYLEAAYTPYLNDNQLYHWGGIMLGVWI